jgi:hypothetical protein
MPLSEGWQPALTVLLVTPDNFETIRFTVQHIRAQTAADRIELLIVAPSAAAVSVPPEAVAGIGACRVVDTGTMHTLSHAKARAVPFASAAHVAFVEDHSFPEPEWAAAIISAHSNGYDAVGPEMLNANPHGLLSWAAMFMHFGDAVEPSAPHESQYLAASHNASYKRDALLALGAELPVRMEMELFLQDALRSQGFRFCYEPAARTRHVNISRLGPWLMQHYTGGRLYGALRARFGNWSLGRRVVYIGGAPLIPLLRFKRTIGGIGRTSHSSRLLPRVVPALAVGLVAHALGEMMGYLLGLGTAERRYSEYEIRRRDRVTEKDQAIWAS